MAWNLPPGCADAQVLDLNSWHARRQKIIDDEYDLRMAELDDWRDKATSDLEAEYVEKLAKLTSCVRDDR